MRTIVALLLVGVCAMAYATPVQVGHQGATYRVADKAFLHKQKDLLRLFKHVFQSNYYKDQAQIAQTFNIEQHLDNYSNQKAVKEFLYFYNQGFLPRGEVFSIFHEEHRHQAVALFHVLYYANNWETFYKTACWAREYVNEGMFVYAINVAVLHRHDTQGMVLPPIYEIYPYFFVNSEVISKANELKMKYGGNYQGNNNQNKYYVRANYSGWYLNTNRQQNDLSYYTEDVGVNAYYYYYNLDYPFWMGGEEYGLNKDRRGELYYFVHQQLLARYYMEKLSNGYGSVRVFDWEEPIKTGFVSTLRYPNGLQFPSRPAYAQLVYNPNNQPLTVTGEDNQFLVQQIEDYERRIRDAIDSGFIYTEDGKKVNLYEEHGFDYLGRIIESNPDSPNNRFYGYLQVIAHQVLGYSFHPVHYYKVHASALEHFETALRDPIFYQFYKRITYYFLQYKSNLPHYTFTQLNYPEVTVQNVEVSKLVTYFDNFEWELTNALYVNQQEFEQDRFQVWARQYRLNHRPFNYKINVQSSKAQDVVVRVFLGPKFDEQGHEIPLNENRVNFIELNKFVYTLRAGQNVIERNSRQGKTVRDRTSYRALYQKVMNALQGQEEFHLDMSEAHNGYPNRLVLPKGTVNGQVYQFYVYISPFQSTHDKPTFDSLISAGVGSGSRYMDVLPFGFPFDRQIKYEKNFFVPNSYFQDVVIYHQSQNQHKIDHQDRFMGYQPNMQYQNQEEQYLDQNVYQNQEEQYQNQYNRNQQNVEDQYMRNQQNVEDQYVRNQQNVEYQNQNPFAKYQRNMQYPTQYSQYQSPIGRFSNQYSQYQTPNTQYGNQYRQYQNQDEQYVY